MRSPKMLLTVLSAFSLLTCFSQTDSTDLAAMFDDGGFTGSKHLLKTNIASIVIGDLGLNYEYAFNEAFTVEVGAGALLSWYRPTRVTLGAETDFIETEGVGFRWDAMLKYYYGRKAPERAYNGVQFRQRSSTTVMSTQFIEREFIFYAGVQLFVSEQFVVDLGYGVGFQFTKETGPQVAASEEMQISGLVMPLRLMIGLKN